MVRTKSLTTLFPLTDTSSISTLSTYRKDTTVRAGVFADLSVDLHLKNDLVAIELERYFNHRRFYLSSSRTDAAGCQNRD